MTALEALCQTVFSAGNPSPAGLGATLALVFTPRRFLGLALLSASLSMRRVSARLAPSGVISLDQRCPRRADYFM